MGSRGWRRVVGFALVTVSMTAGRAAAQLPELEALGGREEITIDAESITYEQKEDTVSAKGNVVIRRGDTVLRADAVRLNRRTSEADATGGATLTTPNGVVQAKEMHVDLDEETGLLLDAHVQSPTLGYTLTGKRIEKGLGQRYRIENGKFTTCNCEDGVPSWSVSGKSLDVEMNGYGKLQGGTFNILDVPVLPIPRAAFPVGRERQSGLLLPRVGVSDRRGFQILQPFYWAINKSQDATIGLDVETSARIGLLGEYRYALSRTFRGFIDASYFNEAIRSSGKPGVPENRWSVTTQHDQQVGPAQAYADLLLVSDDLFFREINTFTIDHSKDVALRTLPFTTSRVGLLQRWNTAMLQGESVYYQDLTGQQSLVLQRVPEVRLASQKLLPFDLFGQLAGSVTNFQRGSGIAGLRGDVYPTLQMRLPLGRSFHGSVEASARETAYQLTEDAMNCGFSGTDCTEANGALTAAQFDALLDPNRIELPSTSSRELVEVHADLNTGVSRVFDFAHFGIEKLKHTIEPRLEYLYVPAVSQEDDPLFDGVDRINQRSLLYYGFASRLLARGKGDGRKPGDVFELTRLSVFQGYDFSRQIPGVQGTNRDDHFSDIDFAVRVNPSRTTSVRFRSTFDARQADLTSATVGIHLRQPEPKLGKGARRHLSTRASLNVDYRFISQNQLQQMESSVVVPLLDRVGFLYATRYDILNNRFLDNYFGVRLTSACDCWSLDLGVNDNTNPNEVEVRAQLTLVGLGSAGESRFDSAY
jgi:LPS-assembly protein